MQSTADVHHHVAHPFFPHPDRLFEHAAAFDTAVDLFDAYPSPRDRSIVLFLLRGQLLPARFLHRLEDVHALQRECLKALVLQEVTPCGQRRRRHVGHALLMDTARMGLTQEQHGQRSVDQQEVFQHMTLVLATRARVLFRRVRGARNGALGAIMTKRGAAVGSAAWAVSAVADARGRGGNAPPSRWRKVSILRQGASPKVRSVVRNTGSKTWIQ